MVNVKTKFKEMNVCGGDFILTSDMESISTFKELTGKSFLASVERLGTLEDDIILNLAACTLRRKETPEKPMGKELFEIFNPFFILFNFSESVIEIITENMPQAKDDTEKK